MKVIMEDWQYATFLSSNFSMSDGFVHLETMVVIFGNANVYIYMLLNVVLV